MTHRLRSWMALTFLGIVFVPSLRAAVPMHLIAPLEGAVLRGGSVATVSWTLSAPLPSGAEEWEAFLSLDDGRDYAVRITPHLGVDVRSFSWQVPNVSSRSVRLLIRTGNERDESIFELPLRLSIESSPERLAFPTLLGSAADRGESARAGDAPVIQWAAGDRSGRGVVQRRGRPVSSVRSTLEENHSLTPAAMEWRSDPTAPPRILSTHFRARSSLHVRVLAPQISQDHLLEASRLNI